MRALVEAILVLAVAGMAIHNASLERELSKWKKDCYDNGYTIVVNNPDGSIKGMRLKTPIELGIMPPPRRTKFFIERTPPKGEEREWLQKQWMKQQNANR